MATAALADQSLGPRGFKLAIFSEADLATRYQCGICGLILRNACQNQCGHRHCEACIPHFLGDADEKVCPTCEREDPQDTETLSRDTYTADFACRRALSKLPVRCENVEDGCTWQDKYKKLEEHLTICKYRLVRCNCGRFMPQNRLANHQETECEQNIRRCKYGCPNEEFPEEMSVEEHNQLCQVKHASLLHDRLQTLKHTLGQRIQEVSGELNLLQTEGRLQNIAVQPPPPAQPVAAANAADAEFLEETRRNMTLMEEKTKISHNLFSVLIKQVQETATKLVDQERKMNQMIQERDSLLADLRNATDARPISMNGVLVWNVDNAERKSRDPDITSILSPPFYTSRAGYKLCGRLYFNGDGIGRGQFMSLFLIVMKGKHDHLLRWPFQCFVTFTLLDKSGQSHHVKDQFRTDPASTSFRRPRTEMNIASGCPRFMSLTDLRTKWQNFAGDDDTLIFKIEIDTQGMDNFGGQSI